MSRTLPFKLMLGLIALSLPLFLGAQKFSNEFLSIGVGARAQAMGNAVVAGVSDVTAGVWNPAGLAGLKGRGLQVGAMHSEWFAGVGNFDYLGVSLPLAKGNRRLGLSLIRFGIDGIPNTLTLYEDDGTINFDNVTEFSAADYALLLSYAQPISPNTPNWLVGGNVKVIHRRIGPFATSWGFGIDLSSQYRIGNWRFGLLAQDITTTFNAWSFDFTDEEKQVLELAGGGAPLNSVETTNPTILLGMAHQFRTGDIGIYPELNFVMSTDGRRNTLIPGDPFSIDPAFGLELDYRRFVFLRAGVNQFQDETDFGGEETLTARPSLGVGFQLGSLLVDYAFTDPGDERGGYSHIVSLMLNLKRNDRGDNE